MERQALTEALLKKRKDRAVIGHTISYEVCNDCWGRLPEESKPWIERASVEVREGDDALVPYVCQKCGRELTGAGES